MAVFSHQTTGNRQNQNYNLKIFQSLYMKVNGQVLPARSGHPSAVIPAHCRQPQRSLLLV
jgi:hypothetical protein